MIYARINVNVDTGVYLFLHISCGTEYSQHSNALAHPNPSANSNKFKLLPYHCYAKGFQAFQYYSNSQINPYHYTFLYEYYDSIWFYMCSTVLSL